MRMKSKRRSILDNFTIKQEREREIVVAIVFTAPIAHRLWFVQVLQGAA